MNPEEQEAANKKIGWVDDKVALDRIGTGWFEDQKKLKENEKKNESSLTSRINVNQGEIQEIEPEFSLEEMVARMNDTNVNEFGRDVDKGDIVFLAQCQCFRAESHVVRKHSTKLAQLIDEHEVDNLLITYQ